MPKTKKKPAEKPEKEEPIVQMRLVYVGPVQTKEGKGGMFFPVSDEEFELGRLADTLPTERIYGGKVTRHIGRPGNVYEFEGPVPQTDDSHPIYPNSRSWAGFLKNEPRVREWQAQADASAIADQQAKAEKKHRNLNLIRAQVAPLKVIYHNLVGHQRTAFLAQIIGYLTSRVTSADVGEGEDDD